MHELNVLRNYVMELELGESISELQRLALVRTLRDAKQAALAQWVNGLTVNALETVFANTSYEV